MNSYSFKHLTRTVLKQELVATARHNRAGLAVELAYIAEFDDRKEFLPEGHPSMLSYCVRALDYSDDAARRRIHAARTAYQYPQIFERVADGRLHLTAVLLLAPHLTPANADGLIEAATRRTKQELEELLAERFSPQPMLPPVNEPTCETMMVVDCPESNAEQRAPERVQNEAPAPAATSSSWAPWPVTVAPSDHAKLRDAQALLRHQIPSGDMTQVLSRLIDLGLAQLQKRKHGAGVRPSARRERSANPRQIPTPVKQMVWARDGGRCTFTNESGQRCPSRDCLEYDHIVPVARGGLATIENLRLRCRAHNQYEAERTFGIEFMKHKRESRRSMQSSKVNAPETSMSAAAAAEVIPWLRGLGFKIAEASAAAALCATMDHEPIEKRVRVALGYFRRSKPTGVACVAT